MSDAKREAMDRLKREAVLFCRKMGHSKDTTSPQFIEAARTAEALGVTLAEIDTIIDEASREAA